MQCFYLIGNNIYRLFITTYRDEDTSNGMWIYIFHAIFTMALTEQNLHNYLTLNVNGHVIIPLNIGHILLVVL